VVTTGLFITKAFWQVHYTNPVSSLTQLSLPGFHLTPTHT